MTTFAHALVIEYLPTMQAKMRSSQVWLLTSLHLRRFPLLLQICSSLEPGQVPGQLLPGVRASRPRRAAVLLSHLLLPERRGANEVPYPAGNQPQAGQRRDGETHIRPKKQLKSFFCVLLNLAVGETGLCQGHGQGSHDWLWSHGVVLCSGSVSEAFSGNTHTHTHVCSSIWIHWTWTKKGKNRAVKQCALVLHAFKDAVLKLSYYLGFYWTSVSGICVRLSLTDINKSITKLPLTCSSN